MTYQQFLLVKLAEEAAELSKIALKTAQFGFEDHHPDRTSTNKEEIYNELIDVQAIVEMLNDIGFDFYVNLREQAIANKKNKVARFLLYARNGGYVDKI